MKITNIAGKPDVDSYVSYKLDLFSKSSKSMEELYDLMFSEKDNILSEETDGYRIKKVTYGECKSIIEQKAKVLIALLKDVPLDSLVGIYLPNSVEWIQTFWSILRAGYRPLLINDRLSDDTINDVLKRFDVKAVISNGKEFKVQNILLEQIKYDDSFVGVEYPKFANEVFLMSSNTSNHLKICGYTGEQFYYHIRDSAYIIHNCKQVKRHYEGNIKLLAFLPFYHIFGLLAVYIWFTFFSRTLVFLKDNDPKTIVNTIKKHKVTHVFSVPLFWETIYKTAINTIKSRGEKIYKKFSKGLKIYNKLSWCPPLANAFSKIAFKEVRENIFGESIIFLISGGGGIPTEVLQFFNAIGYHLANGYGSTELGITSFELSKDIKLLNSGSVGKPFQSAEYKITEDGELLVKGNSIANSIYVDGKNIRTKDEEWYNTHDLACVKKGHYYINGRQDDLIISSHGENINPNLIEPRLKLNGMQNLCLFGLKEKDNIYSVLLIEVSSYLDTGQLKLMYDNLVQIIQKENLSYAVQKIIFTTTPLLEANEFKVNRNKIKQRFVSGGIVQKDMDKTSERNDLDPELIRQVTEIFASALNKNTNEIDRSSHFFYDLGGSSLEYFSMITNIQNEFGVPFPATEQASLATVEKICEYIKETKTKV